MNERPSDVQQWPQGPDPAKNLFFCAGPSEQRAAERSAARRSRSGGPKRAASCDNKDFSPQFDDQGE